MAAPPPSPLPNPPSTGPIPYPTRISSSSIAAPFSDLASIGPDLAVSGSKADPAASALLLHPQTSHQRPSPSSRPRSHSRSRPVSARVASRSKFSHPSSSSSVLAPPDLTAPVNVAVPSASAHLPHHQPYHPSAYPRSSSPSRSGFPYQLSSSSALPPPDFQGEVSSLQAQLAAAASLLAQLQAAAQPALSASVPAPPLGHAAVSASPVLAAGPISIPATVGSSLQAQRPEAAQPAPIVSDAILSSVPAASQDEIGPQSVKQRAAAQPAQPAQLSVAGPQQSAPPAHLSAAAPSSSPVVPQPSAAPPSSVAAPLSRPATSAPPISSVPRRQSYAQVARPFRGPGFVRSHAHDVESFARLPRTGVNIISGSKEGMPSFSFVHSELRMVEELYANALVMKFHGGRPSLEVSQKEIQSWGIEHPFSIGPLSSRAFLLRFQDNADLLKVLTRPSSLLITFAYKVYRWHNLCHMKEDSCFVPIWISLPKLPLQCFIPEFLESVANKIGRFLCFDKATSTLARPSAARICVEIDLRRDPPPLIWVGLFEGFRQQIIYERLPKYCNQCHIIGHVSNECHRGSLTAPSFVDQRVPLTQVRAPASRQHTPLHVASSQQVSDPVAAPPPPPQSLPTLPSSAVHPPSPIDVHLQVQPSAAAPAADVPSTSSAPSQFPPSRLSAAASAGSALQPAATPLQRPVIPSASLPPQNPQPSSKPPLNPCSLCSGQGHSAVECPTGQREATSKQTDPLPTSFHGCMPSVRQNASKKLPPPNEHQQASSTSYHNSSTPSPSPPPPYPILPAATTHSSAPNPSAETVGHLDSLMASSSAHNPLGSLHQVSNMDANQLFWYAVNHQLALNEQARLKAPTVEARISPLTTCSSGNITLSPVTTVPHPSPSSDDSSARSSMAADSQPNSPSSTIQGAHIHYDSFKKISYGSEGEAPTAEPTTFIGHNTDDMIWQRPRNSKRNKRHPDQPLKVQLRARKSKIPNPSD